MNSHNGSTALFTTASRVEGWDSTWTSDLNTAIQTEHHVTPTLEEIVLRLTDTEVFSTREAKCGYWDVQWYWQFNLVSSWNKTTISRGVFQLGSISNGVTLKYFHPNKETILKLKGLSKVRKHQKRILCYCLRLRDVLHLPVGPKPYSQHWNSPFVTDQAKKLK